MIFDYGLLEQLLSQDDYKVIYMSVNTNSFSFLYVVYFVLENIKLRWQLDMEHLHSILAFLFDYLWAGDNKEYYGPCRSLTVMHIRHELFFFFFLLQLGI